MKPSPRRPRAAHVSGRPAPKVRPAKTGAVNIELISIGSELLRGRIHDENARNVARYFAQRGAMIRRITTVDDHERSISSALRDALDRNPHLVISTGGLGPTDNDRTVNAMADALGLTLALQAPAKEMVEAAYRQLAERRIIPPTGLTASREKICTLPVGSVPVPNPIGISPGVLLRLPGGAALLALPGRPDEVKAVLVEAIPLLGNLALDRVVAERRIESPTADESALTPLLDQLGEEFPSVWFESYPSGSRRRGSRIVIGIEASGVDRAEAEALVDSALKRLLALVSGSP